MWKNCQYYEAQVSMGLASFILINFCAHFWHFKRCKAIKNLFAFGICHGVLQYVSSTSSISLQVREGSLSIVCLLPLIHSTSIPDKSDGRSNHESTIR